MTISQTPVRVVAALIWDGPRFLACQRPPEKKRGLLWEFVGGKIEPGETGEEALRRECREELGIGVEVGGVYMTLNHEYPDLTVELTLYHARIREGEPKLLEHADLRWITADEAEAYAFCPADREILERLKKEAGNLVSVPIPRGEGSPEAAALLPAASSDTVVWIHEDFETLMEVRRLLAERLPAGRVPVLAAVMGADWDRDLSPWPADGVFRGQTFSGGGEDYLSFLTEKVLPALEEKLPVKPEKRILAGYSLAGLFALWAAFRTDRFDGIASVSGSLWYDGFEEFVRDHALSPKVARIVLSLGDREKNAKNPRMAAVEDKTREIARLLSEKTGREVPFSLNPGGHFRDVPLRIASALETLIRMEVL